MKKKRIKKAYKLLFIAIVCVGIAGIYLEEWANYGPITVGTVIFSFLVHIMVPVIIASALIKR